MSADEIGVQVSLDHVLDAETEPFRGIDILIDIALRIHHHRLSGVGDQIRGVGETGEIELLEVHVVVASVVSRK
jgi:hypothetical protein